jgi:AcrR family transcriptional regulator
LEHHDCVAVQKLTPERRRQMTRETLIEAAADVFAQKGFNGASLEEIAETAGFTRGAIYSNFRTKEDLLFAVIDQFAHDQVATYEATRGDDADRRPVDDAMSAAAVFGSAAPRARNFLTLGLELRLAALRNPEVRKRLLELDHRSSDTATGLIVEELERSGRRLRMEPRDLADIGRAAVEGLMLFAAVDEEDAARYERLVQAVFVMLAESIEPADESAPKKTRKRGSS